MECPQCGEPLHKVNGKWVCLECEQDTRKREKKVKPPRKDSWQ